LLVVEDVGGWTTLRETIVFRGEKKNYSESDKCWLCGYIFSNKMVKGRKKGPRVEGEVGQIASVPVLSSTAR